MNAPAKIKSQRSQSVNGPECRIAYPFFHERRTKNAAGQPLKTGPRFDGQFMYPKLSADAATCANYKFLSGLCMEAAAKMWPGAGWPAGAIWPIKDGDVPYVSKPKPGQTPLTPEQVAEKNAWRKGYWIFEAANYLDPGPRVAVLLNGQVVEIPARIVNGQSMYKSGDYGIPNLHAYAYQNEQFGVNFGFDGFCFTRPGDAIGNSGPRSAEQMFGGVAGTVAAPAPAMPGVGATPAMPAAPQSYAPQPPMPPQTYAPPLAPVAPVAPVGPPPVPMAPAPGLPALPPLPGPR